MSTNVYCLKRSVDPCHKNDISAFIWHKSVIQTVKYSFLDKILVYQSFYGMLVVFSYFFFAEKLCVALVHVGWLFAKWLLSEAFQKSASKKRYPSSIWHKLFLQMVKHSFLDERVVYQSFFSRLLMFSYFFFNKSSVFQHVSSDHACICKMFVWSVRKNYISHIIWHKSLIQTVKYSSLTKGLFIKVSLVRRSHLINFSSRKSSMFWHASASRLFEPSLLSIKKCYLSIVFALWKWDCWSIYPQFCLTEGSKFLIQRPMFNKKVLQVVHNLGGKKAVDGFQSFTNMISQRHGEREIGGEWNKQL